MPIKFRRGLSADRTSIIPESGEPIWTTDTNSFYIGNGSTPGGILVAASGDVTGPSSSTNNHVVFFNGTTGKVIKDSGLTLSGTNTGDQTITLTGDVTGSGTGSFAASISAGSVTLTKMANLAANSIIGNNTGSAATPIALSGTLVTAMLDSFSGSSKGLVPLSLGGTTNFLRADGTWAAPPNSGGTVTSITTSSPLTGGTITSSGTIGITQASDFQSGSISASDYRQIAKISSSLSGMTLNSAGANARIGTNNLSSQKNLTITVYDEDAIKITTDVSVGPTFIDIAPGYTPAATTTSLNYNGEVFLNVTGTSTGSSPTFTLYGSDGVSNSQISLTQDLYLSGDNATISVINDFNIQSQSIKYTNGTNYVGFQLPTLTADSLYTLPVSIPTSNKVLQSDSAGVMTWTTPSSGTVTSVAALTLGTSGTDLSSSVANGTTTPVITLNVPTASASNRGVLSSADWSTFNGKESALTFSTGLSRVGNTITNTITQYTDALARLAITDSVTGLDYNSTTGVWSTTSGYGIPTTASQTNWDTAYTNRITSLTTTGSSGSATLVSNTLNIPTYTLAGLNGQPLATNLTSLSGLTYYSASFVKMTAAGTFSLDTATYLTGNQTITLGGDLSGSGTTSITASIGANKVTNAMLAQVATATFKGRTTASTGNVEDLTATQATALLDVFTSTLKGLAPASGGGTTNFLRADGTWAVPAGGGGGMAIGGSITSATAGSILFAGTSGVLAQDNTNFFWDNTNKRLGIGQSTPTSRFHLNFNQNSVTQADANGLLLANSTAATVGLQSISPAIVWQGNGWKTNATAGSQDVRFRADVLPVQGAASPTATWQLSSSIAGGAYSTRLTVDSSGSVNASAFYGTNWNANNGIVAGTSQFIAGTNSFSNIFHRLVNNGGTFTPLCTVGFPTSTGTVNIGIDRTNGIVFGQVNQNSQIVTAAAIQVVNLQNVTAGSEAGDLAFYTQSGGTAIAEKMRIFAAGNVGINTGSTNGGYKFDVNGTGRFQNVLTTTGRVHANSRKTSVYTLTTLDRIIFADLATAAFTITLPNHVAGTEYTIIKSDSTSNLLTVNTTSGLINGASTWTASAQYKFITVVSDGSNWLIVAGG